MSASDEGFYALVSLLLRRGYYPVAPECAGEGAQLVNGGWHMPRWGCDTLQHVIDDYGVGGREESRP